MPVTINNTGIVYSDGTASNTRFAQTMPKWIEARTSSDRSLGGDSGWIDHLTVTFTSTQTNIIHMYANMSQSYESGPANMFLRFVLDGTAYEPGVLSAFQLSINRAHGGHASDFAVANIAAGSHTVTLQTRNTAGGSTMILNYWGGGSDVLSVYYY